MSLQFVMGASGSGKSSWMYRYVSEQAALHRDKNYVVLVPDQFTLETQKTLVALGGGIVNVDVLSFHRLAYRVFEERPALRRTVLEDMGKMMLLRRVFTEQKKNLKYFHKGLHKPGFLDECKSFLCELMQYAIDEDAFDTMEESMEEGSLMALKLQDIRCIYDAFREKMGDVYMTAEELVPQLTKVAASVEMLQNAVIVLDGFTGFTPTQYDLLRELLICSDRVIVSVTTDRTEKRSSVFRLSLDTLMRLGEIAAECHVPIEEPVMTGMGEKKIPYRLSGSRELCFLEEHLFAYDGVRLAGKPSDIELFVCRKETDEAAKTAREIFRLVSEEGYRYEDIAVVTSNIASYEHALSVEMNRLGIRYFMDYKKSIAANALAEYLLSFLAMVRKGLDYETTFRFLRGGLSPLTTEETDILENYVVARGRRGIRSYRQEWSLQADRMDLTAVNAVREKFVASVDPAIRALAGGRKTVCEFTQILYELIVANGLYDRLMERGEQLKEQGEELLGREYQRIYPMVMDLFDELVELLGDETVTMSEYEEILNSGISEGLVGFIPPASNQVMIGDVRRSRLKDIKVLFFIGVTDDRIPAGVGTPGILSENERRRIADAGIKLAPSAEEETFTEQFYLYLAMTKPSDRLILSYARMGEDGSSKRPAYLIGQIRRIFPDLVPVDDETDESLWKIVGSDQGMSYLTGHLADGSFKNDLVWWELASWHERREPGKIGRLLAERSAGADASSITKEAAELLYGSTLYGSVTRLEQFARCPYAHFLLYGLGLREREQFRIGVADYGNVFHSAMEHFSHVLDENGRRWADLTEEEAEELAAQSVEYVVRDYKGDLFTQSKRTEFIKKRIQKILQASVWGIWKQMKAGSFVQHYSEKTFSAKDGLESLNIPLENGKRVILGGKIDRADLCEMDGKNLIKIMDYKSGSKELDLSLVYHGLQMQLVTYMAAAMELQRKEDPDHAPVPAAMLYYRMDEPELAWKEEPDAARKERFLGALRCSGYVNDDMEILEQMDPSFIHESGKSAYFPAGFKKDGSFDRYSRIMSTAQFAALMKHTRKKIEEFGNQIYDGKTAASPSVIQNETGCDYCALSGICGLDARQRGACARLLEKMTEEEIWEVLGHGED